MVGMARSVCPGPPVRPYRLLLRRRGLRIVAPEGPAREIGRRGRAERRRSEYPGILGPVPLSCVGQGMDLAADGRRGRGRPRLLAAVLRTTAIVAAACSVRAVLVVVAAASSAAVLRAGAVLAAACAVIAVLVVTAFGAGLLVLVDADALEAAASLRATAVRIEADQDVVDAALDLAAGAGAADGSLRAIAVAATLGAVAWLAFAADQPVAAIELRAAASGDLNQAAGFTFRHAAFAEFDALAAATLLALPARAETRAGIAERTRAAIVVRAAGVVRDANLTAAFLGFPAVGKTLALRTHFACAGAMLGLAAFETRELTPADLAAMLADRAGAHAGSARAYLAWPARAVVAAFLADRLAFDAARNGSGFAENEDRQAYAAFAALAVAAGHVGAGITTPFPAFTADLPMVATTVAANMAGIRGATLAGRRARAIATCLTTAHKAGGTAASSAMGFL
jgi:hypothetical protein